MTRAQPRAARSDWGRRAGAWIATLGLLAPFASCNLIVDTETEQCQTTADCVNKGGQFTNAVCTPDKVCSTGGDCDTNQECIGRYGGPAICRRPERTCVPLTATDCGEVYPPDAIADDSTVVLGYLGPLSGADINSGLPLWQGVKLALNQIDSTTQLKNKDGSTRRLAMVACDDTNDPIAVAEHLAKVVRVPGIIGAAFSGVTLDVANKVTIQAGTLIISPSATSTLLTDLSDNDLVWRTCPSDALQAIPMAQLVGDLEQQIRTEQSLQPSAKIRVAMTVVNDAYGLGLADAAVGKIVFNGVPAPANTGNFLRKDYDTETADYNAIAQEVAAFKPHLVIVVGTTEGVDIYKGVEAAWSGGTERPYYVLSDGLKLPELSAAASATAELRLRTFGTSPGRTTLLYQTFQSSFKGFINSDPLAYAENAYDAAYLLAYALTASSELLPSGAGLAVGLHATVGGAAVVTAGPSGLSTGFTELMKPNGKIDYDGVSGRLDFDAKGEAAADVDVWCVTIDTNQLPQFTSSGQFYNAATGKVEGSRTNCN